MATRSTGFQITARDLEVLTAFDAVPLTADQLLIFSHTFDQPFSQLRLVQRRLQILSRAGLVQNFPYAVASNGRSPYYYKLTRSGYRMLHGFDAMLPNRRYFDRIADNHHFHTRKLADFLVALAARCQREGIRLEHLARENTVAIETESMTLYPDAVFRLRLSSGRSFNFVVELDNGTERVRSKKDAESIERKIRGYDAHQSMFDVFSPNRYVVLFVTTRSNQRLTHMLTTARMLMQNPQRRVFLGACLDQFLADRRPITKSLFRDVRGRACPLVVCEPDRQTTPTFVTPKVVPC